MGLSCWEQVATSVEAELCLGLDASHREIVPVDGGMMMRRLYELEELVGQAQRGEVPSGALGADMEAHDTARSRLGADDVADGVCDEWDEEDVEEDWDEDDTWGHARDRQGRLQGRGTAPPSRATPRARRRAREAKRAAASGAPGLNLEK